MCLQLNRTTIFDSKKKLVDSRVYALVQRKMKALMKWRQFHDRPRPRWFEATTGFLKLSLSGPEFSIVYNGKIIHNGGRVGIVPLKSDWKKQDGSEIWKRHILIKPENMFI